ncbi:MAG: hypothetical protein ACYC6Y_32290 [Thermoguttaceae bacterium]
METVMSMVMEKAREASEGTGRLVGDYPLPSVLSVFAAGLGLGLLAVAMLPDTSRERDAALTKRVFDAVSSIVPEAIMKRMSS